MDASAVNQVDPKEALLRAETLHHTGEALRAAANLDEILRAVVESAVSTDAVLARLNVLETRAAGPPTQRTVAAEWRRHPDLPALLGEHLPLSSLDPCWQSAPDRPLFIIVGDAAAPELQEDLKSELHSLVVQHGVRAIVVLPLSARGRLLGMIYLAWRQPRVFGEREHYLYAVVMSQASFSVNSCLLYLRSQQSLQENQRQRGALESLLNNLPIGVLVAEPITGKPMWINQAGLVLLGSSVDSNVGAGGGTGTDIAPYRAYVTDTDTPMEAQEMPLARAIDTGELTFGLVDIVQQSGLRLTVDTMAASIRDENGEIIFVMSIFQDITERRSHERDHQRMQEELIAAQATALTERSTPLIPISNDILVMPLIGAIDSARAAQLMDTLLYGVAQSGARYAILDITGVRDVDSHVANTLIQAAKAVRLLGVQAVLTGVRAEVAQTLVSLGIDLTGLVTRSTLQSGIAYALRGADVSSLR